MSLTAPATPTGTQIYSSTAIPAEWEGVTSSYTNTSGWLTLRAAGTLTWRPPIIRPGRAHTLTLQAWVRGYDSPANPAYVIIQGRSYQLPAQRTVYVTHEVDPARPLTLSVTNVSTWDGTITVTAAEVLPERPLPAHVLALDAWLPIPTAAMRWDATRWDRAAWNSAPPVPGTLVWDQGRWDQTYWEDEQLTAQWMPILDAATSVTAARGVTADGPVLTAQAGTLTIDATDELSPRALGMVYGTPLRLYHWPTATLIWSGYVTDIATTPAKTGHGTTTITGADSVARLVTTTRYGARPDTGRTETWRQRLARLMTSAPQGIAYRVASASDAPVVPTVWETSLAAHLDALVATTGGAWCAGRDGALTVWASLPTDAPALTLTDTHDATTQGEVIAYTDGPATWAASAVIAAVELTTHDAAPDESGDWQAADVTLSVSDTTRTTAWGGTSVQVDVLTPPDTASMQAAGLRLLSRATDAPQLRAATYWPASPRQGDPAHSMAYAAALDPLTSAATISAGERAQALIARVSHEITPTRWKTDLTLTPKGQTE